MEDVAIIGGPINKTSVTLAIYGEDLDPVEVSRILSCQPTRGHRRGDRKHPNPKYSPYPKGAWLLNRKGMAPVEAEQLIDELFSLLPNDDQVWKELSSLYQIQVRIAIHMNGWNKGFDLKAQSIQRISDLGASMVFDVYAYGKDEVKLIQSEES